MSKQPANAAFLGLACELRQCIYGLTFAIHKGVERIKLSEAKALAPPTGLLLACKQIHDEASVLYQRACQQYRETSRFILDFDGGEKLANDSLEIVRHKDYGTIKNVLVQWTAHERFESWHCSAHHTVEKLQVLYSIPGSATSSMMF